ncbi:DUF2255 family protein [Fructilactobacillus fructivorans]|uniref:DUF2255 family protein n=1 Tax=Fructilactobacillus fructivorans TaxID=1614 RepID=A0AAE6P1C2_9LACO|nr:DUF2255 family protein [Fructilactobacillus fructivorans]KRK56893.1 hypothetical protein FC73_GL001285 [Fructilactobacillus fructivorans]KRN41243.1 hypothetical protein IV51_GL000562 [Fructilactobacillus fructivorans]KRN43058.1 hypothetical protein IV48_GL000865 [Fructilactobacillus fructivorans]QFX93251.1 DUF2255 family protein [Fructilactobacillus fructivorans]RDV65071.1 DUF2255 family protein [Fructilactobacillus fructivorans]
MAKNWTDEQLKEFSKADDMHVSPFYDDGVTYGTPTWIWSVVVNGKLYVRAANGQNSSWYKSAMKQGAGRIHLANQDYEVNFAKADDDDATKKAVSDEYKQKYAGSPYMPPMLEDGPVSATVQAEPK